MSLHQLPLTTFPPCTGRTTPASNEPRPTTDLGLIDMKVVAFIGTSYRHDHKVLFSLQTKVVHWEFEEVCMFIKPLGEVDG